MSFRPSGPSAAAMLTAYTPAGPAMAPAVMLRLVQNATSIAHSIGVPWLCRHQAKLAAVMMPIVALGYVVGKLFRRLAQEDAAAELAARAAAGSPTFGS